jgi:hypothetical protein
MRIRLTHPANSLHPPQRIDVKHFIRDTNQHHLFLVWMDDCFDPPVTLVASDSIESAIDAYCENQTVINGQVLDPFNYGYPTMEELFHAHANCETSGLWVDSEGNMHDIDHLQILTLHRPPNYPSAR